MVQIAHRQGAVGVFRAPDWSLVLLIYTHFIGGNGLILKSVTSLRSGWKTVEFVIGVIGTCCLRLLCLWVQFDSLLFVRGHLGFAKATSRGCTQPHVGAAEAAIF